MTCCNVIIPNNQISLCILPMAECSGGGGGGGGPRTFWYFGYFLTIWAFLSNTWQFTQNYKLMIQWRKIISFDFHHIPKLSIGFKCNSLFLPTQNHVWAQDAIALGSVPKSVNIKQTVDPRCLSYIWNFNGHATDYCH